MKIFSAYSIVPNMVLLERIISIAGLKKKIQVFYVAPITCVVVEI
jgi:hypothetical protein